MRWEAATETPNVLSGANVIFRRAADRPTRARRFEYGINTDWLGKVVEAAGGVTLDVAIKDGITGPLGMDETAFLMSADQRAGSTPIHVPGEDGAWVATDVDLRQDPEYWAGGHGLHSTPRDYLKFQQALLHDGTFGGVTILSKETVDAAFTNQIGDLDFPAGDPDRATRPSTHDFNAGEGFKWGYGLLLNTEDVPGRRRAWSGAVGRDLQHPLLGRPDHRRHGSDLLAVPAVRPAGGAADVRRLRVRPLRLPLNPSECFVPSECVVFTCRATRHSDGSNGDDPAATRPARGRRRRGCRSSRGR